MVVVDRCQGRRDQHPGRRVLRRRGFGQAAGQDALHCIDAGRADIDADDPGLAQYPVDQVVVIADALDRAQHQLDRWPPGIAAVAALGMAPQRRPGIARKQTRYRGAVQRLATAVGQ